MKTFIRFVRLKGELLAVFMRSSADRRFNGYNMMRACYAKVGQHGECYDAAAKLKRAKPQEYKELLNELKSIGYENIEII